jgi:type I restriction enzyme R subunit
MGNDDMSVELSEEDTKRQFITPDLEKAGWTGRKIRMEVPIRAGRIISDGKRAKAESADYVLYYGDSSSNKPIAVVEAKKLKAPLGTGREQAIDYAQKLDCRFAFTSNGTGFTQIDLKTNAEQTIERADFPTVQALTQAYLSGENVPEKVKELWDEPLAYIEGKSPRYYQTLAINRTVDAVARGKKRALLVMATGTGKTYVASEICWKLLSAHLVNKVLYLADRNVLINQTITGDFKPFSKIATTISKRKDPTAMKAYNLFFALYQGLTDKKKNGQIVDPLAYIKDQFPQDYFDLIIVDECHRGSARKDSQWRAVLEYFTSAVQIGMTATPKETKKVSNIDYFGEPLLTYKLNDGIDDGFLAPYRVIRVNIDRDVEGYRPAIGTLDEEGVLVPDEIYEQKDFDKKIIIDDRTNLVAQRITDYLQNNDPMAKTIVFCIDIEHAERMAQALRNDPRNKPFCNSNLDYIVRVTGDSQKTSGKYVEKFSDPDDPYPVICTTSDLMTTGVDCKTCKVIAIDTNFGDEGMTKFKQIIGRGTRVREDYDKYTFTILDFRNASRLFADPEFNGDPICVIEVPGGEPLPPNVGAQPDPTQGSGTEQPPVLTPPKPLRKKIRVNGVEVQISNERISFYDENGKLVTEKYTDFTKQKLLQKCPTLGVFLTEWSDAEKRKAIRDELADMGIDLDELRKQVNIPNIDDFDLLCHVVFDQKPLTRSERANNVRQKEYFEKYSDKARKVLDILLEKYADGAIDDLSNMDILKLPELAREFGTPVNIVRLFGGKEGWLEATQQLSDEIYRRVN